MPGLIEMLSDPVQILYIGIHVIGDCQFNVSDFYDKDSYNAIEILCFLNKFQISHISNMTMFQIGRNFSVDRLRSGLV